MSELRPSGAAPFETRKQDHIRLALDPANQAFGFSGLDQVLLVHEALPEIDFENVDLGTHILSEPFRTPFFVSSMTAGHAQGEKINERLAEAANEKSWLMGVGSQRRQIESPEFDQEWHRLRKRFPKLRLMGNLGLTQLIGLDIDVIRRLVDSIEAFAMVVHTNPLQEVLQPEGTPHFRGGLKALEDLCKVLPVPVVLKETGCGFSEKTLARLKNSGIAAVDVSGLGGTHWGRLEGQRSKDSHFLKKTSETFRDWGISTADCMIHAIQVKPDYEVWASGGVRSGLDAARLLAMGAKAVGFAKPLLESALEGPETLIKTMATFEYELKCAMFCTGFIRISDFTDSVRWSYTKNHYTYRSHP